jgi:hypothetical protein
MTFRASVLTLYPDMFPGPLGLSLAARALEQGIWSLEATNIRDFAADKHKSVDDTPAGGGGRDGAALRRARRGARQRGRQGPQAQAHAGDEPARRSADPGPRP